MLIFGSSFLVILQASEDEVFLGLIWGLVSYNQIRMISSQSNSEVWSLACPSGAPRPVSRKALPLFSSLQLRYETTAALTQASSAVQAATMTVTGAKTLLADLEGTCVLLNPGLCIWP